MSAKTILYPNKTCPQKQYFIPIRRVRKINTLPLAKVRPEGPLIVFATAVQHLLMCVCVCSSHYGLGWHLHVRQVHQPRGGKRGETCTTLLDFEIPACGHKSVKNPFGNY